MEAHVEVSGDQLSAYLTLTQPHGEGKVLTYDEICDIITRQHQIAAGLDLGIAKQMLVAGAYNRRTKIAQGTPALDGLAGTINYTHEPTNELKPSRTKTGEVDYRNLGLVKNITSGEIIANITPPTEGEDGVNVLGAAIKHKPGQPAKFQVGIGTLLSEDGLTITAAIDGNLAWQKDRFVVDETLTIKEDVGPATGNIDFLGNVVIKGGVMENFVVRSKKNISIAGGVHTAEITAGGDIDIKLGAVYSTLKAEGSVRVGFCESTHITCKGDVITSSLVACNAECEGMLNVTAGRGILVGGKCTAVMGFTANTLGNDSFIATRVTVGRGGQLAEERNALQKQVTDLEENIRKLAQIAGMLQEHKKRIGSLTADREAMLTSAIRSRFTMQREVKMAQARINEINEKIKGDESVVAIIKKELWPGVTIRIGTLSRTVDKHWTRVQVAINDEGDIELKPIVGQG
jgi:uncharacterized protein (DUF342 family)